MKRYPLIAALAAAVTILSTLVSTGPTINVNAAAAKAFPGVIGFGSNTIGGRGGKVIYVTNLNDSGPGSLRAALAASGPRTVVFGVSGTISLNSDLEITEPYVTIAGQSAGGQGIQIKGGMVRITTNDVIIRYLKVREGNPTGGSPADTDSISIAANRGPVSNVVIDHSTLIWGTDIGGLSVLTDASDVTIQDSIIGEGLYNSTHPEAPHSTSLNLTQLNDSGYPTRITIFRNLITSSDTRNPQVIQAANVDLVNNVIYNWGQKSAYGNPKSLNLINNTYVKGPLSKATYIWDLRVDVDYPTQNNNAVYESGNATVGFTGTRNGPSSIYLTSPAFASSVPAPMSAQDAYNYVVANAGANLPVRDEVDQRIISNLTGRTMRLPNGASGRFVNDSDLVWPNLSGNAPVDNDKDGMADAWEQSNFGSTSRGSADNSSADADGDGFTDLEEYLNGTNPGGTQVSNPAQPTPTVQPTGQPTLKPTVQPTGQPTLKPTVQPTGQPTVKPTLVPSPTTTAAPTGATLSFNPSDDATVQKDQPTTNAGTAQTLVVSDNPNTDAFVKFKVAGVSGRKVTKAILRFYAVDGSDKGGRLKVVNSNDWNETGLNWKNRPESPDDAIASLSQVQPGNWYELDITSAITGDGTFSFRLTSPSTDGVAYSSKEGAKAPQLILTIAR